MLLKLFLLFFFVPLVELALLIKLGQVIGVFNTILLVVITAALGAALAKYQGLQIWFRLMRDLRESRLPGDTMLEGVLIFVGGLVLLTPGLITDIAGFFCLIPSTRRWLRDQIKSWLRTRIDKSTHHLH